MLNATYLLGNVTKDTELKHTANGTAVANIVVAVNRTFKDKSGTSKEEATFVPVVLWGKTAENAAKYLKKGDPVLIEGRLKMNQWETEGGEKKSFLEVVAEIVRFLPRVKKSEESHETESIDVDEEGAF